MSLIRANVKDQVLRITESPTIASGGQNEVKIAFTFCEKWNGFVKTAVFYRDEDNIYPVILDDADTCVVPWEVYYEPGTFYIGVFGDKDEARRTSTLARYKVKKGAITGEALPPDPTPEVYDQILSAMAAVKAEQETFVTEVETVMNASIDAASQAADNANKASAAVNQAIDEVTTFVQEMTEAKENGEFKGEKGDPYELTQEDMDGIADMVLTAPEIKKIMDDIAELKYVPIDITSVSNNVGTKELGSSVDSVTVSWAVNKEPKSQTVHGESVDASARSKTIPGPFSTNQSFAVAVTDEKGKTDTASTSISFPNGVYYGVLEDGAEVDSAAILSLTRKLQGSKGLTFTATAGATQRFAYAIPTRYGTPTFKDVETGFKADFTKLPDPIAFTNDSKYTENYDVWLSTNIIPKTKTFSVS